MTPVEKIELELQLAKDIRRIDGNHDLGACELAEKLVEIGYRPALREPGERELLASEMQECLKAVETWWLEIEMPKHHGAPHCIFWVREILSKLPPASPTPAGEADADIAAGRVETFGTMAELINSLPMPAGEAKLSVGDFVEAVPPFALACGNGRYERAIAVSVEPMILVSEWGDMLWSATLYEGCVRPIGQAPQDMLSVAVKRYHDDYPHLKAAPAPQASVSDEYAQVLEDAGVRIEDVASYLERPSVSEPLCVWCGKPEAEHVTEATAGGYTGEGERAFREWLSENINHFSPHNASTINDSIAAEAAKLLGAPLREEIERLKRERDAYAKGATRNAEFFTEIGNAIGLEGAMFREFGKHHLRERISSIQAAEAALAATKGTP